MPRYRLLVVRVKGCGVPWVVKATVGPDSRYRPFRYKREAQADLERWRECDDLAFGREFGHNFHSAAELGLREE